MTDTRPHPITDALRAVGPGLAALVAVVNGLGSAGLLSAVQTSAIETYAGQVAAATAPTGPISLAVGAVVGLVSGGAVLLGLLRSGRKAEAHTTPISSPQDVDGVPLARVDGLPLGGNPHDTTAGTNGHARSDTPYVGHDY